MCSGTTKSTKMKLLGLVGVIFAVYCVHAKVYFREEFLDGGKYDTGPYFKFTTHL